MDNRQTTNRVEHELNEWRNREERFKKLFPMSIASNRPFLLEKLKHYDHIVARYKHSHNLDEQLTLSLLLQERKQLEKQAIPSALMRLLRKILIKPLRERHYLKNFDQQQQQNNAALLSKLESVGFNGLSAQLSQKINQGQDQFTIPVSYFVNSQEKLDHQLSFAKNNAGQYEFAGFTALLNNQSNGTAPIQQFFQVDTNINATQAYNLLAGRSVEQYGKWIQLDLNDKDKQGNYRINEFPPGYGYQLEEQIKKLPIANVNIPSLQADLRQGNRVSLQLSGNNLSGAFFIEANPRFHSLDIYDVNTSKVKLENLLAATAKNNLTVAHKAIQQDTDINTGRINGKNKRISRKHG